jgi:hypothetical protein
MTLRKPEGTDGVEAVSNYWMTLRKPEGTGNGKR